MRQNADREQKDIALLAADATHAITPPGLGALDDRYKSVLNQGADLSEQLIQALNQGDAVRLTQISGQLPDVPDQWLKVRQELQDSRRLILLPILMYPILLCLIIWVRQRTQRLALSQLK